MRTAVRRLCGQPSIGPSGVADQSNSAIRSFMPAGRSTRQAYAYGLEVAHRVHRGPADTHLEMQVRTGRMAGVAAVADHLALRDGLADRDRDAGLVAVAGGQRSGVLDAGVVAIAAHPARDRHAAA